MAYKAEGRLHKIFATEQKTGTFQAREFVIEMQDGKFPQMVKFQLTQEKCELVDSFNEGDTITVDFDLRGREWNDKYFTNLNAWRLSRADGDGGAADEGSDGGMPPAKATDFDDDIPF